MQSRRYISVKGISNDKNAQKVLKSVFDTLGIIDYEIMEFEENTIHFYFPNISDRKWLGLTELFRDVMLELKNKYGESVHLKIKQ